ncbi:MAG TPA: hypothetical protein VG274_01515, partial [Rhizomicrobium sp.]|nr:hypothetical protein [Rhizomicrobium sp.]
MTVQADTLVIFGATGDLARRMLLPSLYFLQRDGLLDERLRIVGAARSDLDRDRFRALVRETVEERAGKPDEQAWLALANRLDYCRLDASQQQDYPALGEFVGKSPVFYLSLSPQHYSAACANLRAVGLATAHSRIVVEKPIGHDLESCRAINACLAQAFDERRVFRIDHYLGKET